MHISSSYQGFGHGRLFLNLGGSLAFPHVDLGAALVQDVAVLNQSGISMVTQTQDREDFAQDSTFKVTSGFIKQSPLQSTYVMVQ